MAGSRPITQIPAGLLGMLQLKNVGRNPAELSDVVSGTIDLGRWYMETLALQHQGAPSAVIDSSGGIGGAITMFTTNPVVVPQNEWWWVSNYNVRAGTSVDDDILGGLRPAIRIDVGLRYVIPPSEPTPTMQVDVALGGWYHIAQSSGFWAPPNAEFGFTFGNLVSPGGITFVGDIRYVPLPI